METDITHTQEIPRNHHQSNHYIEPPQGRGEEVDHEKTGRDTERETRNGLHQERDGEEITLDIFLLS